MRQIIRNWRGVAVLGLALTFAGGFVQAAPTTPAAYVKKDTPDWSKLRAAYDYGSARNPKVTEEAQEDPNALMLHLTFTGPSGEKVPGVFLRPKAEGVYPCALLLHGLTSKKEAMIQSFGRSLVAKGIAVLALDAPHHGERKVAGENQWTPQVLGLAIHEGVRDYRSALDYLLARKDIDKERVGLIGYSMGAMMGAILGGVDTRISFILLCVGGDPIIKMADAAPAEMKAKMMAISPSLFVGHISPRPVMFYNGKKDNIVQPAAIDVLYAAAKEPKQIEWFDSGHILPVEAFQKGAEWMAAKLKP